MTRNGQGEEDLVEPQGVNSGEAVDAGHDPGDGGSGEGAGAAERPPAETPRPDASRPDASPPGEATPEEMVGLPDQRSGYPGQQRSVDTG